MNTRSAAFCRFAPVLTSVILVFTLPCSLWAADPGALEVPPSGSSQSGIGIASGWKCNAGRVDLRFDGTNTVQAAYGTSRADTSAVCKDDGNNGFGLLINWNLLGDGSHTVEALADGVPFASANFTVTTLGTEFLAGRSGECTAANFPQSGNSTELVWQESTQNFVIVSFNKGIASAANHSTPTLCAEEDNIDISLSGNVESFVIDATQPISTVEADNCAPDFSNCAPNPGPTYSFTPGVFKLFDDGETIFEAVREASWWRPKGMAASVDGMSPVTDIHYIRVYRKIADADSWPQFFVLYMDGNLRLIPHPRSGISDVCFGSSVIIGPVLMDSRPIAEIASVTYIPTSQTIEVIYQNGGSAVLGLHEVNRSRARVAVTIGYPTDVPFAAFRSMFVADGNADVDHVLWTDTAGMAHEDAIMTFPGGEGTEWFFHRITRSQHNTSAPDIRIRLR